jgi:hypothetical protein
MAVLELPKYDEMQDYQKMVANGSGEGTLFKGNYYTLMYVPKRIDYNLALKCEGIVLCVINNKQLDNENKKHLSKISLSDITSVVLFKVPSITPGFFASLFGMKSQIPAPFRERLKEAIRECMTYIKEKEKHKENLIKSADHVIACQRKIDKTMSTVAEEVITEIK